MDNRKENAAFIANGKSMESVGDVANAEEVRWITKMVCGYCGNEADWDGDYVGQYCRCPKCNAPIFRGASKRKL